MNEPNDTAQEGFDQLKRNLEVRYPEDSDLSLDEFLNVESLLALAVRVCGPGADPRKADRLLSNYQLIRPETIGADGHLMQMRADTCSRWPHPRPGGDCWASTSARNMSGTGSSISPTAEWPCASTPLPGSTACRSI